MHFSDQWQLKAFFNECLTFTQSYTQGGVNHAMEQLARIPMSHCLTIHHVPLVAVGRAARGDVSYHWPWGTWGWDPRSNHDLFPSTQEGCRGCWSACRAVGRTDRQTQGGRVKAKDGVKKLIRLNRDCLFPHNFQKIIIIISFLAESQRKWKPQTSLMPKWEQAGQVLPLTNTKGWLCGLQPGSSTWGPTLLFALWFLKGRIGPINHLR